MTHEQREIREAVRQCLEVRDRIMTGGDSTMTTSTEHAMAEVRLDENMVMVVLVAEAWHLTAVLSYGLAML